MGHKNEVRDVQYVCMRACIYVKFAYPDVDFLGVFLEKKQQHKRLNNFLKKCQKEAINVVCIYLFIYSVIHFNLMLHL